MRVIVKISWLFLLWVLVYLLALIVLVKTWVAWVSLYRLMMHDTACLLFDI